MSALFPLLCVQNADRHVMSSSLVRYEYSRAQRQPACFVMGTVQIRILFKYEARTQISKRDLRLFRRKVVLACTPFPGQLPRNKQLHNNRC